MNDDTREEPAGHAAGGLPRGASGGGGAAVPARGRHRSAPGRARAAAAAGLAVLALLSLVFGLRQLGRDPEVRAADVGAVPAAASTTAAPTTPAAAPVPRTPGATPTPAKTPARTKARPAPKPAAPPPGPPARFRLPAADVAAPVLPVGVRPDGELRVPESPREVGWWVGSAPAGSARGSTVLAGHVDSASDGVGTFAALRDVAVGTRVELVDAFGGTHPYRVVARRTYPKYDLPRDVFRVSGDARLVLITCGGPFDEDAGRYRDNVVVYAVPSAAR